MRKRKNVERILITIFILTFLGDLLGIAFKISFSDQLHLFFAFECFIIASYIFFIKIIDKKES